MPVFDLRIPVGRVLLVRCGASLGLVCGHGILQDSDVLE